MCKVSKSLCASLSSLRLSIFLSTIMDSCNSGSIQSSSCGDEEYDSRAESNISAFFNNNNPSQAHPPPSRSHLNPQASPPQHHQHMFDPLSNYLDSIQKSPTHPNQNPFLNLDMVWSKPTRSEPNPADLGGLMSPSSSSQQNQAFLFSQLAGQTRNVASVSTTHHYSLPPPESASRDQTLSNNNSANNNTTTTNMVRNPKKRSRASRRAPTTVLTTDTTNFRAMVQEFTGIPAPPFTSSPFPRTRLDLFGSAAIRSASSTHLDPPIPPYLLRPFAQKVQPPQSHSFSPSPSSFPPSSSMVENLASNNSTNNNPSTNSASASINYHLASSPADHLGLLMKQQQQQQQPLNMHNQILGFQSISQASPKYTLGNCSKTQQASLEISPSVDSHLKMGVLEELGLSHAHVNNNNIGAFHQNMVPASSEHGSGNNHNNNNVHNSSADWAHRTGTVTDNDGHHNGGFLGSLSGIANYRSDISERVSNGKVVNYSPSPSEFRVEKGPECGVAARGEGTVESWINCSSD